MGEGDLVHEARQRGARDEGVEGQGGMGGLAP